MEVCLCGHDQDAHDSELGYCEVRRCRCTGFVTETDLLEDRVGQDDLPEELNFDQ